MITDEQKSAIIQLTEIIRAARPELSDWQVAEIIHRIAEASTDAELERALSEVLR